MVRFSLAVAVAAFFPALPPMEWALIVLVVALLLTVVFSKFAGLRWALLGLFWGLSYGYWGSAHKLPESWQGVDVEVLGQVVELPIFDHHRCRFILDVESINPVDQEVDQAPRPDRTQPRKLRLSHYDCPETYQPGDQLHLIVRLKRPRGYRNPGSFDSERRDFSAAIDGVGYVRSLLGKSVQQPTINLHGWRWRLSNLIAKNAQNTGPEQVAVLQALLVGDKREISAEQWQLYRQTGVIHLLVISGLHIGLVCAAAYGIIFYAGRLLPNTSLTTRIRVAVFGALLVSLVYSLMAGFSLPTQRAWVMVAVLLIGWLLHRRWGAWFRLKCAVTAVLVLDPLAFLSAGFWLSFGAAGVLLYVLCGRLSFPQRVVQLTQLQLAIMALMVPLLAFYFYQVPVISPLVNLIAVPVVSFLLLPLAFLSLVVSWVSDILSSLGFYGCGLLLQQGSDFLHWVNSQLNWFWHPPALSPWSLGLALIGTLVLLLPAALPGRWLGILLWLPMLAGSGEKLSEGDFRVTALDVGQGLAVVVETANHRMLYDTGRAFASGYSLATAVVEPYLRKQGISQLELLMISHGDNDHSGGTAVVVDAFAPKRILSSVQLPGVNLEFCQAGQNWHRDGVTFEILHPDSQFRGNSNNHSCVLKISGKHGSALFTGDIEASVEQQLARKYGTRLEADILLAPHHGSKSSSSSTLLDTVNPSVFLISSGFRNRFGHPHRSVLERVNKRGIAHYNTAASGAISVISSQQHPLLLTQYAVEKQHYWWN